MHFCTSWHHSHRLRIDYENTPLQLSGSFVLSRSCPNDIGHYLYQCKPFSIIIICYDEESTFSYISLIHGNLWFSRDYLTDINATAHSDITYTYFDQLDFSMPFSLLSLNYISIKIPFIDILYKYLTDSLLLIWFKRRPISLLKLFNIMRHGRKTDSAFTSML